MKKSLMASASIGALAVASIGVGALALTVSASPAMAGNAYIALGAGIATGFDRDFDHEDGGAPCDSETSIFCDGAIETDLGPIFEGAIGYDLGTAVGSAGLRVELQVSYIDRDLGEVGFGDSDATSKPPTRHAGSMSEWLFMANLLVDFDVAALSELSPYVGAGVGVSLQEYQYGILGRDGPTFVTFADEDDADIAFQILAGASIALAPNVDFYGNYRLLYVPDADIDSSASPEGEVNLDDELSHAFTFGLRYNFM